jgi:hypothetical protein
MLNKINSHKKYIFLGLLVITICGCAIVFFITFVPTESTQSCYKRLSDEMNVPATYYDIDVALVTRFKSELTTNMNRSDVINVLSRVGKVRVTTYSVPDSKEYNDMVYINACNSLFNGFSFIVRISENGKYKDITWARNE